MRLIVLDEKLSKMVYSYLLESYTDVFERKIR